MARFESAFSKWLGVASATAVCNGSVALDLAFGALNLPPGSEVILPSFTIISCAAAIVRAGLRPVCVDCDPRTYNMTVEGVEGALTSKTSAVLLVHTYGLPAEADAIVSLARQRNLRVVEDCAEILGQRYRGKLCGTFGDVATFSFYANKHISTGEGGMVTTADPEIGVRLHGLKSFSFGKGASRFHHEALGWNFRLGNMQAAVGLAQLERLDDHLALKRSLGMSYNALFKGYAKLQLPLHQAESATNIYWVYPVLLNDSVGCDAAHVIARCETEGVICRPFFHGMHEQPVFRRQGLFHNVVLPVTERLSRRGFYLPMGPKISSEEQRRVVDVVCAVLG